MKVLTLRMPQSIARDVVFKLLNNTLCSLIFYIFSANNYC